MRSTLEIVHSLISAALHPRNFYAGNGLEVVWLCAVEEEIRWEVFRGRLLDPAHTRQTRRFLAWNIHQKNEGLSAEPLLSVKWDRETGEIHVVRAILSHVWEGYDAGTNVIETRETTKWVRELVGSLAAHDSGPCLSELLRAAVRGTSRLPLTSLEAPLPAFSLGQMDYVPGLKSGEEESCFHSWREITDVWHGPDFDWRILETVLRAVRPEEVKEAAARTLSGRPSESDFLTLFQNVSLSPYTCFVDNALAFLSELVRIGRISVKDQAYFFRRLLVLLNRHLTAYDLITYHHRGANYPDALLLDAVLKAYLALLESHPELVEESGAQREIRTALRQACLLRRHYEGLPVPDAPTSPGENARVLPPPHVRVPDEQLTDVLKRRRQLYANDPLPPQLGPAARRALSQSIDDLITSDAWKEMGLALFIDRPLGWDKPVGESDQTPLLSQLAFSAAIARRRYAELLKLTAELGLDIDFATRQGLEDRFAGGLALPGVPIAAIAAPPKPCVSLADAARVSADFVVVRTLGARSVLERHFTEAWPIDVAAITSHGANAQRAAGFTPAVRQAPCNRPAQHGGDEPRRSLIGGFSRLMLCEHVMARLQGEHDGALVLLDGQYHPRLEMAVDASNGFARVDGVREFPSPGLRILRSWPG